MKNDAEVREECRGQIFDRVSDHIFSRENRVSEQLSDQVWRYMWFRVQNQVRQQVQSQLK